MIIEIVFGIFGLMGMGWLYVGNFLYAILIFAGFFILLLIEVGVITLTFGICACLFLPLNIVIAVVSGLRVRDHVRQTNAKGSVLYVIIAASIGFLLICGLLVALGGFAAIIEAINSTDWNSL